MAVRPILTAEAPVLRRKAVRVKEYNEKLRALVADMWETLHEANGLGLAGPQIGVSQRVVVIEIPANEEEGRLAQSFALCNPEIVKASGEDVDDEGCLSVPGYYGEVKRAATVTVKGFTPDGKAIRVKGHGLLARALQHELDHLEGILFVDHLDSLDKLHHVGDPKDETLTA